MIPYAPQKDSSLKVKITDPMSVTDSYGTIYAFARLTL
jgi:hypothetical protein